MLVRVRLGLMVGLASFPVTIALAQDTTDRTSERGGVTGQRNGAIRSLGAAGYNGRGNEKEPAVAVPPLDEGPSRTGGVPLGTTTGRRIR